MSKYVNVDALKEKLNEIFPYWPSAIGAVKDAVDSLATENEGSVSHDLMEQVEKYAADMEERFTEVCSDFRERTGQDYVCGSCKYGDCVYMGADGDYCGECPGFESDECFVLSDDLKRKIWKIVDIVSDVKMDEEDNKE